MALTKVRYEPLGTGAASRTVEDKVREKISAEDYAQPSDPDHTDRLLRAIAHAGTLGGADIYLTESLYEISADIVNNADSVRLIGRSRGTVIRPTVNNITLIRQSASDGGVENLTLDSNGKTGIRALALVPEDEAQTTAVVNQNFNVVHNLLITNCDEGIVLAAGPDVAGVDSGCWYNNFSDCHIKGSNRGLWLKDGTNIGSSGVNRNQFKGIRIGQGSNTGLQIDSGDTNTFYGIALEGIQNGTAPNTVPTAIKIALAGAFSGDNNDNIFYGAIFETCTRHIDNANSRTHFYGHNAFFTSSVFAALPGVMVGSDPSQMPVILPGQVYQTGNQITGAYDILTSFSGRGLQLRQGDPTFFGAFDEAYSWKDYVLDGTNTVNITTFAQTESKFQRFGKFVDWHFRVQFQAASASSFVEIDLPLPPETALYQTFSTVGPMSFSVVTLDGAVEAVSIASFDPVTNRIKVKPPSGVWNTGGVNNNIKAMLKYRVA